MRLLAAESLRARWSLALRFPNAGQVVKIRFIALNEGGDASPEVTFTVM
ncbi:MAG: hypothetical protein HS117_18600 [Verrucomicrobiaceae bacterium]|nr:hypothetical protein [Verrucomicrobiaceae bacterium]